MQQQEEAEQIINYQEVDGLSKRAVYDYSEAAANGCAILALEHSTKTRQKRGLSSCLPHHRRAFLIGIVLISLILLFIAVVHSHSRSSVSNVEPSINSSEKVLYQPLVQSTTVQAVPSVKKMNTSQQKDKEKLDSKQTQNQKINMQVDREAPQPDWQTKEPNISENKPNSIGLLVVNPVNPASNQPFSLQSKSEHQKSNEQIKNRRNQIYEKQKAIRQQQARLKAEKDEKQNILKNVLKNPYLQEVYANITQTDLIRVRKWRYIVNVSPDNNSPVTQQEKQYFQRKYQISKYQELNFCIVVPTFNNKARKRYYRNIKSILMQDYTNYKVIVIDDASTDGTGDAILNVLQSQNKMKPEKYRVIIQKQRHFAMPNLRYAAQNFCSPTDIFMIVDGDDELIGKQVLKLFNAVFQKEGVWFAYSNFLGSNSKLGYSRPYHSSIIQNNEYRKYSFAVSHLRAYYTQLFLNIDQKDLKDENGKYLTSANDMAICIPALQQAHKKITYIPQLTYFYNFNTGLNVHRARLQEQRQNNLRIREKKSYQPLVQLFPE